MSYLDDLSAIWEEVKISFREQYAQSFIDLWFGNLKIHAYENNTITLSTTSEFTYKIVTEKYIPTVQQGFSQQLGFDPEISLIFIGTPTSAEKIIQQIQNENTKNSEDDLLKKETSSSGVRYSHRSTRRTYCSLTKEV